MAEVHAARVRGEAGFQKLVAVKRMLPALADDEDFVQMFLDEARLAAHIESSNCVSTLDLGRATDGSLYIVMELVVGVTLSRILRWAYRRRDPIPLPIALEFLSQAAKGLHDAHVARTPLGDSLDLVHRDVSPQNILVGVDGRVRLTDFGVARAVLRATHTETGRIKGKFAYSSPEQLRGGKLDQRSDVFSLAVVAWEVLAGQRLFVGEHPAETMEKVRAMPIPDLIHLRTDIPPAVSAVVAQGLDRAVETRTPSAKQFMDELVAAGREAGLIRVSPDELASFVEHAGGNPLQKIRENIKLALTDSAGFDPIPEALEPGFTPSGVKSAPQPSSPSGPLGLSSPRASVPTHAMAPVALPGGSPGMVLSPVSYSPAGYSFPPPPGPSRVTILLWFLGGVAVLAVGLGVGWALFGNRSHDAGMRAIPLPAEQSSPPEPTAAEPPEPENGAAPVASPSPPEDPTASEREPAAEPSKADSPRRERWLRRRRAWLRARRAAQRSESQRTTSRVDRRRPSEPGPAEPARRPRDSNHGLAGIDEFDEALRDRR